MNVKIVSAKITIVLAIICIIGSSVTIPVSAKAYVLDWNLVDSGKHLDVDGNSTYMKRIWRGQEIWNGYKKGVIRKDSATRLQDVFVSDINKKNGKTGITSSNGKIQLNKYYLKDCSVKKRTNTATHELGHALGLAHSTSKDIMGPSQSSKVTLSKNDKDSYDKADKNY